MEVEKSAWIERLARECYLTGRYLPSDAVDESEGLWAALEAKGYIKALGPVDRHYSGDDCPSLFDEVKP